MSETATAPRAKLPLWRTVRESYAWGLGHLPEVARKAWRVLAVLAGVSFVLHWVAHPYVASGHPLGTLWITAIALPIFVIAFTAMIAVPWHRFVLAGEPLPHMSLTMSPRVVAYMLWGLLLAAPMLVSLVLMATTDAAMSTADEDAPIDMAVMIALITFVAAVYVFVRLGIKLVPVALREADGTLSAIWRATAWNFWRLFWGTLMTLLPVLIFAITLAYVVPDQGAARWLYAIGNMLYSLAEVMLGMVSLTFLSLAYRHFFRAA